VLILDAFVVASCLWKQCRWSAMGVKAELKSLMVMWSAYENAFTDKAP
jgi:hypothetical protein